MSAGAVDITRYNEVLMGIDQTDFFETDKFESRLMTNPYLSLLLIKKYTAALTAPGHPCPSPITIPHPAILSILHPFHHRSRAASS